MTQPYTRLGKQILGPNGKHFADACDPTAAAQITDALNAKAGGGWQSAEGHDTLYRDMLVWREGYLKPLSAWFNGSSWTMTGTNNVLPEPTHIRDIPPAPGAPA